MGQFFLIELLKRNKQEAEAYQKLPLDIVAETTKTENLPIKTVSPAEQTVQQAVSELKRENINPDSVMKVSHKSKSRRRKKTSVTKQSKVPRRRRKSKNTSGRTRIKIAKISRKAQKGGKKAKPKPSLKRKKSLKRKDIFSF